MMHLHISSLAINPQCKMWSCTKLQAYAAALSCNPAPLTAECNHEQMTRSLQSRSTAAPSATYRPVLI
eukprot:4825504-Pleurochrysis_carterae.AAC.8